MSIPPDNRSSSVGALQGMRSEERNLEVMTAAQAEMDPEAVLVLKRRDRGPLTDQAIRRTDALLWHIIDAERAITWCGLFIARTWDRLPLSETPEDRRCPTCVTRFGHDIV